MNSEAIVVLLLLWAVLLVPGALRSRNSSPHATVGGFERAMDVLRSDGRGPDRGRSLLVPRDAGRIVDREVDATVRHVPLRAEDPVVAFRRAWFHRSVAGSVGSLLLATVVGGWSWLLAVVVLLATAGYVALLRHLKLQRDQAKRVVAQLDLRREEFAAAAAVGDDHAGGVRLRRWEA